MHGQWFHGHTLFLYQQHYSRIFLRKGAPYSENFQLHVHVIATKWLATVNNKRHSDAAHRWSLWIFTCGDTIAWSESHNGLLAEQPDFRYYMYHIIIALVVFVHNSVTTFLAGGRDDKKQFFVNQVSAKQDGNIVANVSTRLHWSSSGQYMTTMSKQSYLYTVSEYQCQLPEGTDRCELTSSTSRDCTQVSYNSRIYRLYTTPRCMFTPVSSLDRGCVQIGLLAHCCHILPWWRPVQPGRSVGNIVSILFC